MAKEGEVEVGDVAKDSITGFEGVVIAETKWLNGCTRITIQPQKLKDGKPIDSDTFDINQIVVVKKKHHQPLRETGGPRPQPKRAPDPR